MIRVARSPVTDLDLGVIQLKIYILMSDM
jgi:hypothetical protein